MDAMKPLPVAPLTYEDSRIWDSVDLGETELSDISRDADCRDAALMLALTECQPHTGRVAAAHRRERTRQSHHAVIP